MKADVVEMLRKHYMSDTKKIIGFSPPQEALEYLASVGDKTFLPELKSALCYAFIGQEQSPIPLLIKMDGKKWDSFYIGGSMIGDIDAKRGDWGDSGKPIVDHSPEDGGSINRFFEALGRKNPLSNSGNKLTVARVDVIDADRVKLVYSIMESDSQNEIYQADVIFRGTGLAENPWLITKVENLQRKAPLIGGSAYSFLESGKAKSDQKDYDGAIADYNKGLLWRPGRIDLLRARGWAKALKGDYDGAIAQFDSMIQRGQEKATCYNWRGIAKEKKGDIDGAVADYRRAIDVNPNLKNELLPKIEKALANKK